VVVGFNHLGYDLNIDKSINLGNAPVNLIKEKGQSNLFQFYSQSKIKLLQQFELLVGFHSQYFELNKSVAFEPRIALKYKLNEKNKIALAYGLHSKIESLPIYFVKDEWENQPNRKLELMKSNHLVLSFSSMLTDNLRINVEPYYQYLKHVPITPDSYITTINIQNNLFFNHILESTGTGRNIGIDFTLERYLSKGLYYMLSASIFDSKYTANDGIERNTRFNKNYVFNALIGKEWQIGRNKNNLFSANIRLNYLGGNRKEAVNWQRSIKQQEIIYGENDGSISFIEKRPDTPISSFTLSFRKNKSRHSSLWSLQVLNATQTKEFEADVYNIKEQTIEQKFNKIMIPNLSYKIEF